MSKKKKEKKERPKPLFVKKNDIVVVISGDDRGKQGKVLKVFPKEQRIIVEGINFIKRHTRPSQKNPQGGIIEKEAPIHVSNVMVVCSKCGQPTRVGHQILNDGSKIRVCKKCGEMLEAA